MQILASESLLYKARHAHKRLYTVLPKYSKIQVLPGITSCRLVKDNKQAIELKSLLINNMPEGGYEMELITLTSNKNLEGIWNKNP